MATSQRLRLSNERRKRHTNRRPIVSYGVILLYFPPDSDTYNVLLYQRRDSFEYMDFIRGIWHTEDHAMKLLEGMRPSEKKRVLLHSFDEIWNDLWVDHSCRLYTEGYQRAKYKFIRATAFFSKLPIDSSGAKRSLWGFPKGKKNYHFENPIDCALREFEEETHIPRESISIQSETPFVEIFTGSNNRKYMTKYFLGVTISDTLPELIDLPGRLRTQTISEEAAVIRWCSREDATMLLNSRRVDLLINAVDTYDTLAAMRSN